MEKIDPTKKRMAWLSADLHKWIKHEATERETTISEELDIAVKLLRERRAKQAAAHRQQVSA